MLARDFAILRRISTHRRRVSRASPGLRMKRAAPAHAISPLTPIYRTHLLPRPDEYRRMTYRVPGAARFDTGPLPRRLR